MFNRFKTKPTLFLIGGTITILCLIPAIIYYIPQNGGGAMYALVYMMYAGLAGLAIVADVVLVKFINFKTVSVIEAGIAIVIFLLMSYESRTLTVDFSQTKKPYLIMINDSKGINIDNFKNTGLFNKIYTVKDSDVIHIDTTFLNSNNLNFKSSANWKVESSFTYHKPEYVIECEIVLFDYLAKYSDNQRDSLVQRRLVISNIHNKDFKGY